MSADAGSPAESSFLPMLRWERWSGSTGRSIIRALAAKVIPETHSPMPHGNEQIWVPNPLHINAR